MKKSYKKMSATGLAAALVASAIVPAASAETPTTATVEVSEVVVKIDGKLVKITMGDYTTLFLGGKEPVVEYITLDNGKTFSIAQYSEAFLGADFDNDAALTDLTENKTPDVPTTPVLEGTLEGGEIKYEDSTPSDTVESVSAITETVFKGKATQLQFSINGSKEATSVAELTKAGYTVTFETTLDGQTSGNVTISDNRTSFEYKVVVFKDGKEVAKTELKKVTVQDPTAAKKITKHEVKQGTDIVSNLVFGTNGKIDIKEYEQLDGEKKTGTVAGVTYKSSNQGVVVVDSNGNLITISAGTANITVSKAGLEDYVIPVTVVAEKPVATSVTGLANTSLSVAEQTKALDVVVKDQYDAPVNGGTLTFTSSNGDIATAADASIGTDGKAKIIVTALKAGTTTLTVKAGDKVLGAVTVTVQAAGEIASYSLETTAKDLTLDRNTGLDTPDNELTFKFVARDAQGLLVADLTSDAKYSITSSNEKVATIDATGKVTLATGTDATTGTTKITVKEGSVVRAEATITVVDTTKPDIANEADLFVADATFGGFTVTEADNAKNTVTLTYSDAANSIGGAGTMKFNVPVKVASIAVDGTQLSNEVLYQLVAKTGTNFVTAYAEEITLANVGTKISDLVQLGKEVTVKYVNEAGYEGTYTFTLKEATPAEEEA